MNYKLLSLAALMLVIFACEVSTDVDDMDDDIAAANIEISTYNEIKGINDTLSFRGSFSEDVEPTFTVSGDSEFELEFVEVTETELKAFIPANVEAGDYDLVISVGEQEITSDLSEEPLTLKIQDRAVISELTTTEFAGGEEITIEGGPFINNTDDSSRDPQVWFMATGYTNTVSEVTVSEDGSTLTFIADEEIPDGEYKLSVTTGEDSEYYTSWSNEIMVTVTE